MTIDTSPNIGLGQLKREAFLVLLETLTESIEQQNEYWKPFDEELAELRKLEYEPLDVELVLTEDFYLGHNPSLIQAPIEKYPNVAVDADRAGSAFSDDLDQAQMYGVNLYIEFMVKSEKSEEEVSARADRMLDAINICMMSNRTLRGSVHELSDTPTVQLSDVFVRKDKTSYGERWFWRGGRMEYEVSKVSQFPSGSSVTAADFASIDQS
jgi:hypothetical protein